MTTTKTNDELRTCRRGLFRMAGLAGAGALASTAAPALLTGPLAAADGSPQREMSYDEALAILRAALPEGPAPTGYWVAAKYVAVLFGESVFGYGVDFGLDSLMGALGLGGSDPTADALSEISASIAELSKDVDEMKQLMAEVVETLHWQNFQAAETQAADKRDEIAYASGLVRSYHLTGNPPTTNHLDAITKVCNMAVYELTSALVSMSTGAVTKLQIALQSQPTDVAWAAIDDYRNVNRAALAEALFNLSWAAEQAPGYEEDLLSATERAVQIVDQMYDRVGVGYPQVPDSGGTVVPYLHAPGTPWVVAPVERPHLEFEQPTIMTTRETITPAIDALRAAYASRPKPGLSFEAYLSSVGLPTAFAYQGTYSRVGTRVVCRATRIIGNDVHHEYPLFRWLNDGETVSDVAARDEARAPYTLPVATNDTGMPVLDDAHAVELVKNGPVALDIDPHGGGKFDVTLDNPDGFLEAWSPRRDDVPVGYREPIDDRMPRTRTVRHDGLVQLWCIDLGFRIVGDSQRLVPVTMIGLDPQGASSLDARLTINPA